MSVKALGTIFYAYLDIGTISDEIIVLYNDIPRSIKAYLQQAVKLGTLASLEVFHPCDRLQYLLVRMTMQTNRLSTPYKQYPGCDRECNGACNRMIS